MVELKNKNAYGVVVTNVWSLPLQGNIFLISLNQNILETMMCGKFKYFLCAFEAG